MGTLQEHIHTYITICRRILIGIRNVSDQEKIKTHIYFNNSPPPPPEHLALNEIMWENMVQPDRPQITLQYGACALHAAYVRLHKNYQVV
jgi:hypothetical protein